MNNAIPALVVAAVCLSMISCAAVCAQDAGRDLPGEIRDLSFAELSQTSKTIEPKNVANVRKQLWEKYKAEEKANPIRVKEFKEKRMTFNGSTMHYEYSILGDKPETGRSLYIALHGGGGAPKSLNDSQWNHMKVYYKNSVKEGVYVATRGIADTWNLHFMPNSFTLYDRLIENMILFEDVNPDRVYILGFSAGGDAVYRLATAMTDRWAAANMSAGHPGNVNPKNLFTLPFLIQVGAVDRAYDRHLQAAKFDRKLEDLGEQYPDGFRHETFIHHGKPHNIVDRHPQELKQKVIASPRKWLEHQDQETKLVNTNAISWLKHHTRNPWPKRIIWDLQTRVVRNGIANDQSKYWQSTNRGLCHYWIQVSEQEIRQTKEIDVVVKKESNTIEVNKIGQSLTVLLNQQMCDLTKPISVHVDGQVLKTTANVNLQTLARTLLDRGDPRYMFESALHLTKSDGNWNLKSER